MLQHHRTAHCPERTGFQGLAQQQSPHPPTCPVRRHFSDTGKPGPRSPKASRIPASSARHHGHQHDGPESQQARVIDRVGRVLSVLSLSLQRKIHHHNAVLFHNAKSERIIPIITRPALRFSPNRCRPAAPRHRPTVTSRRMVIGWIKLSYSTTKNDVHGHPSSQDQQRLIRLRTFKRRGCSLKSSLDRGRHVLQIFLSFINGGNGAAQSTTSGARLNETVTAGNCL